MDREIGPRIRRNYRTIANSFPNCRFPPRGYMLAACSSDARTAAVTSRSMNCAGGNRRFIRGRSPTLAHGPLLTTPRVEPTSRARRAAKTRSAPRLHRLASSANDRHRCGSGFAADVVLATTPRALQTLIAKAVRRRAQQRWTVQAAPERRDHRAPQNDPLHPLRLVHSAVWPGQRDFDN